MKEFITDPSWWGCAIFIGACIIMMIVFAWSISDPTNPDWEFVKTYKPNKKKSKSRRRK